MCWVRIVFLTAALLLSRTVCEEENVKTQLQKKYQPVQTEVTEGGEASVQYIITALNRTTRDSASILERAAQLMENQHTFKTAGLDGVLEEQLMPQIMFNINQVFDLMMLIMNGPYIAMQHQACKSIRDLLSGGREGGERAKLNSLIVDILFEKDLVDRVTELASSEDEASYAVVDIVLFSKRQHIQHLIDAGARDIACSAARTYDEATGILLALESVRRLNLHPSETNLGGISLKRAQDVRVRYLTGLCNATENFCRHFDCEHFTLSSEETADQGHVADTTASLNGIAQDVADMLEDEAQLLESQRILKIDGIDDRLEKQVVKLFINVNRLLDLVMLSMNEPHMVMKYQACNSIRDMLNGGREGGERAKLNSLLVDELFEKNMVARVIELALSEDESDNEQFTTGPESESSAKALTVKGEASYAVVDIAYFSKREHIQYLVDAGAQDIVCSAARTNDEAEGAGILFALESANRLSLGFGDSPIEVGWSHLKDLGGEVTLGRTLKSAEDIMKYVALCNAAENFCRFFDCENSLPTRRMAIEEL